MPSKYSFNPFIGNFDYTSNKFTDIDFNISYVPASETEGKAWWNTTDKTLNLATGLGPVLQVGFEDWFWVYNDTVADMDNGQVVHPIGGATGGKPHVELALAEEHVGFSRAVWVLTMDVPAGTAGIATKRGLVRGVDTSTFGVGDNIWLSTTVAGGVQNTLPEFPNYPIQIGGIAVADADGTMVVAVKGDAQDTVQNAWNGTFREDFDLRISSNGTTITGTFNPSGSHDNMTMIFSDGFHILDTSPPLTIALTPAGVDTAPVTNYIFIPKDTQGAHTAKTLSVVTDAWPTTFEHIRVAQVLVQTAATVQEEGALRNQNWNDPIADTNTFQGHMSHLGAKLRQFEAQWDSGAEGTISIDAGAVYVKSTSGSIFQMHPQTWQAQDMTQYTIDAVSQGSKTFTITGDGDLSGTFTVGKLMSVHGSTGNDGYYTVESVNWSDPDFIITVEEAIPSAVADGTAGDDIHIVNSDNGAYIETTDLASETNDANGNPLNNTSFSVVVWGVANKGGEPGHLMANMPLSTYNKNFPEQAVVDADSASVYTIPKDFQGVGFLIARFTFVNSGGTWTLYETQDLRGFLPNTTAGAGAGSSGITTLTGLTDTPSTYVGEAGKVLAVSSGETTTEFIGPVRNKEGDTIHISADGTQDYTTIQAALDDNARAGVAFLVHPGTYTDTINFTANDQAVRAIAGCPDDTVVQQADAQVVDFGSFTGCDIIDFEIKLTAPTTDINLIGGTSTFSACLYNCHCELTSTVIYSNYLMSSTTPSSAEINVIGGKYTVNHSGNAAGPKYVYSIAAGLAINATGAEITINGSTASSFTAAVSAVGGTFTPQRCKISATDNAAAGGTVGILATGAGSFTMTNNLISSSGNSAGTISGILLANPTATITSNYNSLTVTQSGAGTGYAYNNAVGTINVSFDQVNATTSPINGFGTVNYLFSDSAGNFSVQTDMTIGGDVTDGTNATSAAEIKAAYDHVSNDGSDHSFIDQSVVSGATPTFTNTNFTEATDKNYVTDAEATVIGNTSNTNTGDEVAADLTTAGVVELATAAEVDTGTDATRAVTPDGLQGSNRNIRWLTFNLVEASTACATATNIAGDFVSPIAGTILQSDSTPFYLYATNSTAGTTGTMVVDISIGGTSIMTTNKLDFDTTEKTTTTAATPPDLTTTALAVGDIITIDIDSIHTTAAEGLTVYMAVRED